MLNSEVISTKLCDVTVLEMGEDERRAGDVADFAGAGGDVLEGAPALAEQGGPAFARAAQGPQDGVAGTADHPSGKAPDASIRMASAATQCENAGRTEARRSLPIRYCR